MLKDYEYADFETKEENWNEYKIEDGTTIRVKFIMVKILRREITGGHDFRFNSSKVISVNAPLEKSGKPSDGNYSPEELFDSITETDMKFKQVNEEKWNKYLLKDGTKIMAKLAITDIGKTDKYDEFGDPIYNIQSQPLFKAVPPKKR